MTFKRRSLIMGILAVLAFGAYGGARFYSPVLVAYVVEETLVQKAPDGMDPARLRERFRKLLELHPDPQDRLQTLLAISQALEKVQKLTPLELERLLRTRTSPP